MRLPRIVPWLPALALRLAAASVPPTLYLLVVRSAQSAQLDPATALGLYLFTVAVIVLGWLSAPRPAAPAPGWNWPWLILVLLAALPSAFSQSEQRLDAIAAWSVVAIVLAVTLACEAIPSAWPFAPRWVGRLVLAAAAGIIPAALGQVESRFADEEFFAAVDALAMGGYWLTLLTARAVLPPAPAPRPALRLRARWPALAALVLTGLFGWTILTSYQASFYDPDPPQTAGISRETPFLCGQASVPADPATAGSVPDRLTARVAANSAPTAIELGYLAAATGSAEWGARFRESFLAEAAAGRFTGPSNSVKSTQFEAALRVYFYDRARTALPDLFNAADQAAVRQWFAAVNRRALTVEWVDWAYAAAFHLWPEGPYENQENGAGLLAILEATGLADPALSARNRDYLLRNQRGWQARFRNTDDAFIYQPEWLTNAYFQSLYTKEASGANQRLSFQWLLLQALPDGTPLSYNHPGVGPLAGIAALGAHLLQDSRYSWLAARSLDDLERGGAPLGAQPGAETVAALPAVAPTEGSCLMYGDSGLPNQAGPLAPDKIVFRDGWSTDSAYLLLNLRFSGWHRYKATNAISLIYQSGALVTDVLEDQPISWLPVGRSLFRDKRIPRENLNGLLVPRTGISAVLHALTGAGGPWAQDPPRSARVERFSTGATADTSTTVVEGWRGWRHSRTIHFVHGGPIIIVDQAAGRPDGPAAITWHLNDAVVSGDRMSLRSGGQQVEMVVVPVDGSPALSTSQSTSGAVTTMLYTGSRPSRLNAVTVFLRGPWLGASVEARQQDGGILVRISKGSLQMEVSVDAYSPAER